MRHGDPRRLDVCRREIREPVTERALLAGLLPILVPSRIHDPVEKIRFADDHWIAVDGGHAIAEVGEGAIYLAISLRNVRHGLAFLDRWDFYPSDITVESPREIDHFHRLTRDLYVPAVLVGHLPRRERSGLSRRQGRDHRPRGAHRRSPLRRPRGGTAHDQPVHLDAAGRNRVAKHGLATLATRRWSPPLKVDARAARLRPGCDCRGHRLRRARWAGYSRSDCSAKASTSTFR